MVLVLKALRLRLFRVTNTEWRKTNQCRNLMPDFDMECG
jgi:hypothetical protein